MVLPARQWPILIGIRDRHSAIWTTSNNVICRNNGKASVRTLCESRLYRSTPPVIPAASTRMATNIRNRLSQAREWRLGGGATSTSTWVSGTSESACVQIQKNKCYGRDWTWRHFTYPPSRSMKGWNQFFKIGYSVWDKILKTE